MLYAANRQKCRTHKMSDKRITEEDALLFHAQGRPGKLEITATKPLTTQRDLSLAYSPGVAVPCLRIEETRRPLMTTQPKATRSLLSQTGLPCWA